jgi:Prp8 binding protein
VKKFAHTGIVNSCCPVTKGPTLIVSGSDDNTIRMWDIRYKRPVKTFENGYQVTSVCFNGDNSQLISGGLDGDIKIWDLKKDAITTVLQGHSEIVTSLSLSPDGNYVLSNAMDSTLRKWDVRPYVAGQRCKMIYYGVQHGFERNLIRSSWSPCMRYIGSGSSDRFVYIWDTESGNLRYHLPGHTGSVNEVIFHPKEPIVGSCGSDKNIYFGELVGM